MIIRQYKLAWQFMKERVNRKWIICIAAFMAAFFIVSFIIAQFDIQALLKLSAGDGVDETVQDTAGHITWYGLFLHNIQSNFICILLGMVPFVPLAVADIAFNIFNWGLLNGTIAVIGKTSIFTAFAYGMLPHCIFEVPANCLSLALSIVLFTAITRRILKKSDEKLTPLYTNIIRVFILFVIPLLLAGGIVEAEITPLTTAMLNVL